MEAFLREYGLWILLAGVFVAMHWFGMGCGGGHRHGARQHDSAEEPGKGSKPVSGSTPSRGCH